MARRSLHRQILAVFVSPVHPILDQHWLDECGGIRRPSLYKILLTEYRIKECRRGIYIIRPVYYIIIFP